MKDDTGESQVEAGVEGMLKIEVDGWREREGSAALSTSADFPRPEPEGTGCVNILSTSLSYIKLNVVAKNGASPDAIIRMCPMSDLGSLSVKCWRNWISMSMIASWLKRSKCEETSGRNR